MSGSHRTHHLALLGFAPMRVGRSAQMWRSSRHLMPLMFVAALLISWVACIAGILNIHTIAADLDVVAQHISATLPGPLQFYALAAPELAIKMSHKLLPLVVGLIPVMLLEIVWVGFRKSSIGRLTLYRSMSGNYDIGMFLISFLGLLRVWTAVGTLGLAYLIGLAGNHVLGAIFGHQLQIDTGIPGVNFALYLLAFTFFDYWCHRIFHANPFWCLHRFHHAGSEMTTISAVRDHPGVALIEPMFKLWPLAFFAAPATDIMVFAYALMAYEFLIHSNVPWTWGWVGRWLIVPPAGHRLHHSIDTAHNGKLLGILPIWDRLFGTWCDVTPDRLNLPVGVEDQSYNSGNLAREILRDLTEFVMLGWTMLTRRRASDVAAETTS